LWWQAVLLLLLAACWLVLLFLLLLRPSRIAPRCGKSPEEPTFDDPASWLALSGSTFVPLCLIPFFSKLILLMPKK
jgi:hypothetical protein